MVFAQTQEEVVLTGAASNWGMVQMLLSRESDQERLETVSCINSIATRLVTASLSYVGKANYREAERYIRDFRPWTSPTGAPLLIEISAVGGRFTLDVIQKFSNPIFVNAFLEELEENDIVYDLQDVSRLELPNVRLPWAP